MNQQEQGSRHPDDKRPRSVYSFVTQPGGQEFTSVQEAFAAKRADGSVYVKVNLGESFGFYKVQRL
jgi:hypothetical protein